MPIELMQVVAPDNEAVDLWLDVDAALAVGLAQDDANSAIYEVLAGLKFEDEDEADPDTMTTVRLTLNTESLELFLEPGALEELEAIADAVLVDESSDDEEEEEEEEEQQEDGEEPADEADLEAYIQEMIDWFPEAFDGWVYNVADPTATLARQVGIGDLTEVSNQRDEPPSWDAKATLSDATSGETFGPYLVTFMVEDDVPYAYLDGDTFAKVNEAMLAEPAEAQGAEEAEEVEGIEEFEEVEPDDEDVLPTKAEVALLLQTAMGSDDTRRELFWRVGASVAIDDYEIYLSEPNSIAAAIGDELSGERGWWISPKLRVVPTDGDDDDDEPMEINVTAAKLLISADNKTAWIELSTDDI